MTEVPALPAEKKPSLRMLSQACVCAHTLSREYRANIKSEQSNIGVQPTALPCVMGNLESNGTVTGLGVTVAGSLCAQ